MKPSELFVTSITGVAQLAAPEGIDVTPTQNVITKNSVAALGVPRPRRIVLGRYSLGRGSALIRQSPS